MIHSKDLLLVLVLPLILAGCATPENETISSKDNIPTSANDTQTQTQADFQVEIIEDPVEQVDSIENSIKALEQVVQIDQETVATMADSASQALSGLFTYEVDYQTPNGVTDFTVNFTVSDNKITQLDLVGNSRHATSLQYQKLIQDELGSLVLGKDYLSVSALPSKVAGSSLTPTAFNNALAKLQEEA